MSRKHKKTLKLKREHKPSEDSAAQETPSAKARANRSTWHVTTLKAFLLIAILGIAVFATGLHNHFSGDDLPQIVDNMAVHSIRNIPAFFQGSTMYNGPGQALIGAYYHPLMTTTFALVYSIWDSHPIAFHLLQLLRRARLVVPAHGASKPSPIPCRSKCDVVVYGLGRVWKIGHPISVRHNESSRVSEGPTR